MKTSKNRMGQSLLAGLLILLFVQAKPTNPRAFYIENVGKVRVSIRYGQPSADGQPIGGKLVPYGKLWETGEGAATTFDISQDMLVDGNRLKAGKYALFSIPGHNEWTLIFNKNWKQSGTSQYNPDDDALRIKAIPQPTDTKSDKLAFKVQAKGYVSLTWDTTRVGFTLLPATTKQ